MMVDVAAALIRDGDRFMICQRPAGKARGLLWEFVGGKAEPGETLREALVRECREELGILGCLFTLLLLVAIVARCVHVGLKTPNYMNRLICFGLAAILIFQILINVGMCIGVFPVIGLTLPFISYGGSSVVTLFLAMGLISSIHMRPDPEAKSPYIQPRY